MKTKITFKKNMNNIRSFAASVLLLLLSFNASAQAVVYSAVIETWENGAWLNSSRSINTYDASNYLIQALSQTWDVSGGNWQDISRSIYTNDANGDPVQTLVQTLENNVWTDAQRISYTYHAPHKVATALTEINIAGVWQNFLLLTNTYDGSNYLIHHLTQTWNFLTSGWKNSGQTFYTNNPNGTVQQSISQSWDATNVWVNTERSTFTYTTSNQPATELSEDWVNNAWQNAFYDTYDYDAGGHLIHTLQQKWIVATSVWENDSQSDWAYNTDGSIHQVVFQSWDNTTQWTNTLRITYGYEPLATADFAKATAFIVYPNPVASVLYLQNSSKRFIDKITITELSGKIVHEQNGNSAEINVQQLQQGIYVLKIEVKGYTYYEKFLKE